MGTCLYTASNLATPNPNDNLFHRNDPERHSVDNKKVIKRDQDSIETVSRDKKRKKHNVDEEMHSHVDPAAISDTGMRTILVQCIKR